MTEITFTETEDSPGFVHILAETEHNGERIGCAVVMPNGIQQQIKKELRRTLLEHVARYPDTPDQEKLSGGACRLPETAT